MGKEVLNDAFIMGCRGRPLCLMAFRITGRIYFFGRICSRSFDHCGHLVHTVVGQRERLTERVKNAEFPPLMGKEGANISLFDRCVFFYSETII